MTKVCANAIKIAAKTAVKKPSMTKESPIIHAVNINVNALITNKKRPNVKIVIGNVNTTKIGRTIILTIDNSKLAKMAVPKQLSQIRKISTQCPLGQVHLIPIQ